MKLYLAAFLVVLLPACKTTSHTSDVQDIEAACRASVEAWNRGDVEGFLAASYWKSNELTFFSGGDVTRGFEPVLARYMKRYKSEGTEMGKLAFTHLEVLTLSEDAAIARGRWDLDFEKQPDVGGLFTVVFEKKHEGWRIVHDHSSADSPNAQSERNAIRTLGYTDKH
jgi:ketosteroid isomerase-like protein